MSTTRARTKWQWGRARMPMEDKLPLVDQWPKTPNGHSLSSRLGARNLSSCHVLVFVVVAIVLFLFQLRGIDYRLLEDQSSRINGDEEVGGAQESPNELDYRPMKNLGFLIWSKNCKIEERDAYDASIRKMIRPVKPIICSRKEPLTYVTSVEGSMPVKYVLHIDDTLVHSYEPSGKVSCCYSNITRINLPKGSKYDKNVDNRIRVGLCKKVVKNVELEAEEEFILVKCKRENVSANIDVYKNMHAVVPIKERVTGKKKKRKSPDDDDRLNVLIIGYDSISQLNLMRTMPKTVAYLRHAGFVNLYGFNKIGRNTFPNILGLLTGFNISFAKRECWPRRNHTFDKCPFVWNYYRKLGYVTAYIEDKPSLSTFNYYKTGFSNPPTDYYFRPFMVATKKIRRSHRGACLGPARTSDVIMKYILNFVHTLEKYLFFCFAWFTHFGHDDVNEPQNMDLKTLQFFNELNETGIFKKSLVVFMSDHGINFGSISVTYQGSLENKLPYAYFLLPDWFKRKYTDLYNNLLINRRRLVSSYDIHVTLKEVLQIPYNLTVYNTPLALSCPMCKSLLSADVGDRTCAEAGIPPQFCSCSQYRKLSETDTMLQPVVKYALDEIQRVLTKGNYSQLCAELRLKNILASKVNINSYKHKNINEKDYMVMFQTMPGDGIFEANVRHMKNNNRFLLLGEVVRISAHATQSTCIEDPDVAMYCYCIHEGR